MIAKKKVGEKTQKAVQKKIKQTKNTFFGLKFKKKYIFLRY